MKISIGILILALFAFSSWSQDAQDVLKGERSASGDLYFAKDLHHKIHKRSKSFVSLPDSTVILVPRVYTVHLQAYNPLHYTHNVGVQLHLDPIQTSILSSLEILKTNYSDENWWGLDEWYFEDWDDSSSQEDIKTKTIDQDTINQDLLDLVDEIEQIGQNVNKDSSSNCLNLTARLINLNFLDETRTTSDLDEIRTELSMIKAWYTKLSDDLSSFTIVYRRKKAEIKKEAKIDFMSRDWLTLNYLSEISKKISISKKEQEKRISNLDKLLKSIKTVMNSWESSIVEGRWFVVIDRKTINKGDLHLLKVSIKHHQMSIDGEKITKDEASEKHKFFRIRKFNRIVTELSAGTIYTFQDYTRFTTAKNILNEEFVALANPNKLERVDITTMVNFNIYLPNSSILPFIQLGVGLNKAVPLGLLGGGLRFDLGKKKIFAISGGLSITGIKELQDLNVGDVVKDNLEVENDLEYEVSPIKPYFGFQYNF